MVFKKIMSYYSELDNREQHYTLHIMVGEDKDAPIRTFHNIPREQIEKLLDRLYTQEWADWEN